jgi:peptidoglycan/xylan/chitin deacetylase (PgdA/CDA1 family)
VCGPHSAVIADVSGPEELLAEARAGLPSGAATPEATAVRLRRMGVELAWGEPVLVRDLAELCDLGRRRGRDSVEVIRADPSLLPELAVGAWWSASPAFRMLRRALAPTGGWRLPAAARRLGPAVVQDAAFWSGVREQATGAEWRRLARSSYVVLCYHRVAGEGKPGQERMDLAPRRFRSQLAALRLLGWRHLTPEELLRFHEQPDATIGRRRYVVTFDDGFRDAVAAARRAGSHAPQMFVVTDVVGGDGDWLGGEPLAGWDELAELGHAGGIIGSHARQHVRLDELSEPELRRQLCDSLAELRSRLPVAAALIAYPHGAHDLRVRREAIAAGYVAAYTSMHGRNGAGTDRWCLRRVEPKQDDGVATFLWKVLSGSNRAPAYLRRLRGRGVAPRASRRSRRAGADLEP